MDAFEKLEAVGIKLERLGENAAVVLYPDGQKELINKSIDVIEFHRTYVNNWVWNYQICPTD